MKTLHLLWLLVFAPVSVFAQGQINFATIGVGVNAPVTNTLNWQRVPTGNTFLAQLYYGPAGAGESSLISVTNPAVGFAVDGFIIAGTRLTDPVVVAGGQVGTFQVRVWEAVLGATWEQAYQNWNSMSVTGALGFSQLIQVKTTAAPDSPVYLTSLQPFLVDSGTLPEPATAWLGLLGAAAVLYWRKRHR